MAPLLMALGLLLVAALTLGVAVFAAQRYWWPEPSLLARRLASLKSHRTATAADADLTQMLLLRLQRSRFAISAIGPWLSRVTWVQKLEARLLAARNETPVDQFLLRQMVMPLALGGLWSLLSAKPIGLMVALIWVAWVWFKLGRVASKRLTQINAQLPDALSMISSSLRAGHTFNGALDVLATELADPLREEFAQVSSDLQLGLPMKTSLEKLGERLQGLIDIRMFVTAILIQRESGGNLAEVLDQLSTTIRERYKLQGQIKALTGQARLTGWVLGCAPAGLLLLLSVITYSYVRPLFETGLGRTCLMVAFVLQVLGFWTMRRIVDIRV